MREPERSRLWQLLLGYIQSHATEALHGKGAHNQSLLRIAATVKKDHLIPDLIHAGAVFENPHDGDSEWAILISSYHRLYDQEEGGSRHHLEYLKALQAFVEAFEEQDLLYSLDDHGETLLFFAALCGNAVAVRFLLDAGLSALSVGFQGCTALHNALVGAFHLPAEEVKFQELESPGEQRPAKDRALAAILQLLLDAGVGPNSEFVDGATPVKPLHMAIMAPWHLENTALVELLCEHGAQPDTVAPALCGAQPLHVASEAQTFIQAWGVDFNSPPLQISSDEQGEALEAKKLTIMRSLVRLVNSAGVSFISHKDWRKIAIADAIWKCSPFGIPAMLAEGVSPAKALGTG
ncbi:MAG: hypothetical protein L6R38_001014 [Xanthoria sp. 2 TBL-2021]|nr:MAG: hypothetical protein L6R38_001014 [Xanthoria sp. 2 TBL-2021]